MMNYYKIAGLTVAMDVTGKTEKQAEPYRCPPSEKPDLVFVENPDILATVAKMPDAPYCVGFAAESENLREYAEAKRRKKGVPLLVGNIGHETFGKDDNTLILFDDNGALELPHDSKQNLARRLIDQLASRL